MSSETTKFSLGQRRDCSQCGHVYHPANAFQELCWGCLHFNAKDKPRPDKPVDLDPAIKVKFGKGKKENKASELPDDNTK